jgi:hypothetical protein
VIFPADYQTTKPVEPREEALDPPALAVAPERSAVLRGLASSPPHMRCDQFDAIGVQQPLVQGIAVVGLIANQPLRELIEETLSESFFDELAFMWASTGQTNGERKTVIIGDGDDFRALAALGGAHREPPFFAPVNEASMNASSSGNCPRACSSAASTRNTCSSFPSRTHCWKRRWQVWKGGYRSGSSRHCAPVPSTHSTPFNTARVSCHGRPRPSLRRAGCRMGSNTAHCASLTSQRPRIRCRSHQSYRLYACISQKPKEKNHLYLFVRRVLEYGSDER